MTDRDELQSIKIIAKRVARTKRIPHHVALDLVAGELARTHWRALTVAWEKGWRPDPVQVAALRENVTADRWSVLASISAAHSLNDEITGSIDGHPYSISLDFEVLMQGRGWAILVGQAPSEAPQIERTDRRIKKVPITNPEFVEKALAIANGAAEQLRARIAADWPRRSTKPDARGCARHPLSSNEASEWHCLHCDGAFTGAQMAKNMWHCPKCSATPIDIFAAPFWRGT
jgi:hypothetical protein